MSKSVLVPMIVFLTYVFLPVAASAGDLYSQILKLENKIRIYEVQEEKQTEPIYRMLDKLRSEIELLEERERSGAGHKMVKVRIRKDINGLRKKIEKNEKEMREIQNITKKRVRELEKKIMGLEKKLTSDISKEEQMERKQIVKQEAMDAKKLKKEMKEREKKIKNLRKDINKLVTEEDEAAESGDSKKLRKLEGKRRSMEEELENLEY